jgi:hypothetical protein
MKCGGKKTAAANPEWGSTNTLQQYIPWFFNKGTYSSLKVLFPVLCTEHDPANYLCIDAHYAPLFNPIRGWFLFASLYST